MNNVTLNDTATLQLLIITNINSFFKISFEINASNLTLYLLNYTPQHIREVKSHRKHPNRTTNTDIKTRGLKQNQT
jgi:hypothetical protein